MERFLEQIRAFDMDLGSHRFSIYQFPTQFDVRNFNFTNIIILIKNFKQSRTEA